jgi:hypothetical protein
MNRDQFLQRVQQASSSDAQESDEQLSDEAAPASRQNHRQQVQRSEDRLDEELAKLADLYSPPDLVNTGAQ